ncbi:MAG TPA: oxalyl-CoA decarboxylase [Thermoanaerobaculia bacterium]|nr:oxalyl-CoA decarboxylase [Thermoanaerobaculia bacterium]
MTEATEARTATAPTSDASEELRGGTVIARALRRQGVDTVFGVVGFPIYGIARAVQKEGMRYVGFRNEQAASYAAGAVGYLTGRPGVCLTVSGPGMVHAVAGLANAWANCWPMLLIGGANDGFQNGLGAFQEAPQIEAARPFVKYAARPDSLERIPFYVEQAIRSSLYGRPGAVYLDLPNDLISGAAPANAVEWSPRCPEPPRPHADPAEVERALDLLRRAERPLIVVGKGAAYSRAEAEVRALVERSRIPFLPTPMGKGVLRDDHELSAAPARSFALQNADVVLLIGARLNWMLHFGRPPRFAEGVRTIQIDIAGEEMGNGVPADVALVGDAKAVARQLDAALEAEPWSHPVDSAWRRALRERSEHNLAAVQAMLDDDAETLGYYRALREIRDRLSEDTVVVAEGANTMDISRTVLPNFHPRHRLDAGSFGTMGVGCGFAIAAAVVHDDRKVVAVQGDSAFGFSGMEVEVACRHRLPITFIVLNNNGIQTGVHELDEIPQPWAYTVGARYELIAEAFGGRGFRVESLSGLGPALDQALAGDGVSVVNVMIDPDARRKPQEFGWLTR